MMPLPAETGFIELKGWYPFKSEKNQWLNGNQKYII
jgi:hypothetical protein